MRELDFTKAVVIDDVTPDDTQQQSTFDEGINIFSPQNLKSAVISDGEPLPNYGYEGALNDGEPYEMSGWDKAITNFNLAKDGIELDTWKGVKNAIDNPEMAGSGISAALEALTTDEFIESRIKANEIDVLDSMEKLRPYYQKKDAEINFSDMWEDPDHFFQVQLPKVVGGMAGLIVEPLLAGGAITAATYGAGAPMGVAATIGGIGAILASRPFESLAEAQAQYEQAYMTAIQSGKSELDAKNGAAKAFQHNFNENLKLTFLDAAEVVLAIAPIRALVSPGAIRTAIKATRARSIGAGAAVAGGVMAKESWEEGYQYIAGAEAQNIAAGNNNKKTGWAELFYDEGEEGREFSSSVQGGFIGSMFMGGGFAAINKGLNVLGMAGNDVIAKDGEEFAKQQASMQHGMIARAVMNDQMPELEGYIERYSRSGAMNTSESKDPAQIHKSSVAAGQRKIQELRQEAKEFIALKNGNPKVKDFNQLRKLFDNTQKRKAIKESLAGIDKEDPAYKATFEKAEADMLAIDTENMQIISGKKAPKAKAEEKPAEPKPVDPAEPAKTTNGKGFVMKPVKATMSQEEADQAADTETVVDAATTAPETIGKEDDKATVRKKIKIIKESREKNVAEFKEVLEKAKKVEEPVLEDNKTLPDISVAPAALPSKQKNILKNPPQLGEKDAVPYNATTAVAEVLKANNVLTEEEIATVERGDSQNEMSVVVAAGTARLHALSANPKAVATLKAIEQINTADQIIRENEGMLKASVDPDAIDTMDDVAVTNAKEKIAEKISSFQTLIDKNSQYTDLVTKFRKHIDELKGVWKELDYRDKELKEEREKKASEKKEEPAKKKTAIARPPATPARKKSTAKAEPKKSEPKPKDENSYKGPIKTLPKSETEDPQIISDPDEVKLAELRIEKMIATSKSLDEFSSRFNYVMDLGNRQGLNKFVEDRIAGKTNQSFSDWRNGKSKPKENVKKEANKKGLQVKPKTKAKPEKVAKIKKQAEVKKTKAELKAEEKEELRVKLEAEEKRIKEEFEKKQAANERREKAKPTAKQEPDSKSKRSVDPGEDPNATIIEFFKSRNFYLPATRYLGKAYKAFMKVMFDAGILENADFPMALQSEQRLTLNGNMNFRFSQAFGSLKIHLPDMDTSGYIKVTTENLPSEDVLNGSEVVLAVDFPKKGMPNVIETPDGQTAFKYPDSDRIYGTEITVIVGGQTIGKLQQYFTAAPASKADIEQTTTAEAGPVVPVSRMRAAFDKLMEENDAKLAEAEKRLAEKTRKSMNPNAAFFGVPEAPGIVAELLEVIGRKLMKAGGISIVKAIEMLKDGLAEMRVKGQITRKEETRILKNLIPRINKFAELHYKITNEKDVDVRDEKMYYDLSRAIFNETGKSVAEAMLTMIEEEDTTIRYSPEGKYTALTAKVKRLLDWSYIDKETGKPVYNTVYSNTGEEMNYDEVFASVYKYIITTPADETNLPEYFKNMPVNSIADRLSMYPNEVLLSLYSTLKSTVLLKSYILNNNSGKWKLMQENRARSSKERVNSFGARLSATLSNPDYNANFKTAFAAMDAKRTSLQKRMLEKNLPMSTKLETAKQLIDTVAEFFAQQSGLSKDAWITWAINKANVKGDANKFYQKVVHKYSETAFWSLIFNKVFFGDVQTRYLKYPDNADRFKSYMEEGYSYGKEEETEDGQEKEDKKGSILSDIAASIAAVNTNNTSFRYRNAEGDTASSTQFVSELMMLTAELFDKTKAALRTKILLKGTDKKGNQKTIDNPFVQGFLDPENKSDVTFSDVIRKFGGISNTETKQGSTQSSLSTDDLLHAILHFFGEDKSYYYEFLAQQADDGSKYFVRVPVYSVETAMKHYKAMKGFHDELPTEKEIKEFAREIEALLGKKDGKKDKDGKEKRIYQDLIDQLQKTHGKFLSIADLSELYAWNNVVNRTYINEYYTPKYYKDSVTGKVEENYSGLYDAGKRKQDGKGIQLLKSIVNKVLGTDVIKQVVIDDPGFDVVLGEEGVAKTRSFKIGKTGQQSVTDGVIYISESLAKAARESLGTIYDPTGSIKFFLSDHTSYGARILDKANFIVLTKAHAEQFGEDGPLMKLYNRMNKEGDNIHIAAFRSGVKRVEGNKVNKIGWTKPDAKGNYTIDESSLDNLATIDIDPSKLLMQTDLQRDSRFEKRSLPSQIWYHIRKLPNFNKTQKVRNELGMVLARKLEMELFSKSLPERIAYLLSKIPSTTQNHDIIRILGAPNVSPLNEKVALAYNTAVRKVIEDELLSLNTNGAILIDTPNSTGQKFGNMRIASAKDVENYKGEKNNNEFQLNKGDVVPPDAIVPLAFQKHNKVKVGDYIFVTRVPSTNLHSMSLVRVAGFLKDKSTGNMIITHEGIQKIAGADNDGDVRYIWAKFLGLTGKYDPSEINSIVDRIEAMNKDLIAKQNQLIKEENKLADLRGDYENLDPALRNGFHDQVKRYEAATGNKQEVIAETMVKEILNTVGIDVKILEGLSRADIWDDLTPTQADNLQSAMWVQSAVEDYFQRSGKQTQKITDQVKKVRQAKTQVDNINKALMKLEESITRTEQQAVNKIFDLIAEDYMKPENQAMITDPIDTDMANEFLKELKEARQQGYKTLNMLDVLKHISDVQDGQEVIGILARSAAAHGFMKQYDMKLTAAAGNVMLPEFTIKTKGREVSVTAGAKQVPLSKFKHDPEKQTEIDQTAANNTNHAVDNIKQGLLALLGFTSATASLKSMLIFLGYSDKNATYLMQHKVMQDYMQVAREKGSPIVTERSTNSFNLAAKKYANELAPSSEKAPGVREAIAKEGMYYGVPKTEGKKNIITYARDNPPTSKEWNLAQKPTDGLTQGERLEIVKARLSVLRYMNFLNHISSEVYALSHLSKANEKAPVDSAEISSFKSDLATLGYTEVEIDEVYKFVYNRANANNYIEHGDFYNSDAMELGRTALRMAEVSASETIAGNKLGVRIIDYISSWINNAFKYESNYLKEKDFRKISNELGKVIMKIAFDVRDSGFDVMQNLTDEALLVYEEYIADTDLANYISIAVDQTTKKEELQLNTETNAKFTESMELERLREIFGALPVEAREKLVRYHVARFGYNNSTENIGGFANVFDVGTEAMISNRIERVSKFLLSEYDAAPSKEDSKYMTVIPDIAREVMVATNELIPLAVKTASGYTVNYQPVSPETVPVIRFLDKDGKMQIAQQDPDAPSKYDSETISVESVDKNRIANPTPETLIEDMIGSPPPDVTLRITTDKLAFMMEPGNEKLATTDPALMDKIAQRLAQLFPNIKVFTSREQFQAFLDKHYPGETLPIEALGASIGEVIFIDPSKAVQSTRAHEYIHPYWDMLPADHPIKKKFQKDGVSEEEAVTMLGKAVVELAKEDGQPQSNKIKGLLKWFWQSIKEFFGNHEALSKKLADEIWNAQRTTVLIGGRELKLMTETQNISASANARNFINSLSNAMSKIKLNLRDHSYRLTTNSGRILDLTSPSFELKENSKWRWMKKDKIGKDESYTDVGSTLHAFAQNIGNGMSFQEAYDTTVYENPAPDGKKTMLKDILDVKIAQKVHDDLNTMFEKYSDSETVPLSEITVASAEYQMATTIDRLLVNKDTGNAILFDFKTSKHSTVGRTPYFTKNLGVNEKNQKSTFDKHCTQLHLEAEVLGYPETSEVGRPPLAVSEMYIVPLYVKYGGVDGKTIVGVTVEPNLPAHTNAEAKYDARVIVNQKTRDGVQQGKEDLQGLPTVSKETYFETNYPDWPEWVSEYERYSEMMNTDEFIEKGDEYQAIIKKKVKAFRVRIDGALADFQTYKEDYAKIKALVESWGEKPMSYEEAKAALESLQRYDNVAANAFAKDVYRILSRVLRNGENVNSGDIDWLQVNFMNPSNVPGQYPDIQKAMQYKMGAEGLITNQYEHYKRINDKLTKALIKSKPEINRDLSWWEKVKQFFIGDEATQHLYYTNMVDADGNIKRDPLNEPGLSKEERDWLMFNWYGGVWSEKDNRYVDDMDAGGNKLFVGYYQLSKMNGVVDTDHIYDPTSSPSFTEALKRFGLLDAAIAKHIKTDDSLDVMLKFYNPVSKKEETGTLNAALQKYREAIANNHSKSPDPKDPSKPRELTVKGKALVAKAVLLVRKANELAAQNMNEDKTALFKSNKSGGYIIGAGGALMPHNKVSVRFILNNSGKLTSKRDVPKSKDAIITGNLHSAFSASVYDRLFTYHMNDAMPEMLSTMSLYRQLDGKIAPEEKGGIYDYKRLNEWYNLAFRKDILGEEFTDLGVNGDQYVNLLRGWTYLKVMAFNMPIGAMNLFQGFVNTYIHRGGKEWRTGVARYAQLRKARAILTKYDVVTLPDHDFVAAKGVWGRFKDWSELFVSETEKAIQGSIFLGMMTPEQWANHGPDGELTGEAEKEKIELKRRESNGTMLPGDREKIERNYLTTNRTEQMKKQKNAIHGYYDPRDQGNYARSVLLKSLLMFKTWLPAMVEAHAGPQKTDVYGTEMKGILISLYDLMKENMLNPTGYKRAEELRVMQKEGMSYKEIADKVGESEKYVRTVLVDAENMHKLLREGFLLITALTLYAVAHDDDPKKNRAARQVWYAMGQLFTFYNLESWKSFSTAGPPPAATLGQLFSAVNSLIFMEEYKNDGDYGKKGELKATGKFQKLLPYGNLNPTRALGWKKISEL